MVSTKEDNFLSNRVKDLTIQALRGFFAQQSEFQWVADENDTKIIIADKYSIKREDVEKKPIISIQRGVLRWKGRHIGQFVSSDSRTTDNYMDVATGNIIILCVSRQGLEAEELAQFVFHFFTRYGDILRKKGFYNIEAVGLGEERVAKSSSDIDISIVPVTINAEIVDTWSIVENTPEV